MSQAPPDTTTGPDYSTLLLDAYSALVSGTTSTGEPVTRDQAIDLAAIYLEAIQTRQIVHVPAEKVEALRVAVNEMQPPGVDPELLAAALDSVLVPASDLLQVATSTPL